MKPLAAAFRPYQWAPTTLDLARRAGIDPVELIRFDGNVPPLPLPSSRPATVAAALARVNEYPRAFYTILTDAIAEYAGVAPENIVLGAGADDLILLVTRAFAGPGDRVAIANDPTYPMFQIAVWVAGAEIDDHDPVLTICCRPNNPTGELGELPTARPLVVDEAYFEYSRDTAAGLIEEGVIVLRTFSKVFGLAGARVGYALAGRDVAAELNKRQHPAPLSTLSAALAIAALRSSKSGNAWPTGCARWASSPGRRMRTSSTSRSTSRSSSPDGSSSSGSQCARSGAESGSRFATRTTTNVCWARCNKVRPWRRIHIAGGFSRSSRRHSS